jgi:hypothetical protein
MESVAPGNPRAMLMNQGQENQRSLLQHMSERENSGGTANNTEVPLPSDLRRILKEVAGSGACSSLSWENYVMEQNVSDTLIAAGDESMTLTTAQLWEGQAHASHRRTPASSCSSSKVQVPARKKHGNTLQKWNRRRCTKPDAPSTSNLSRKRPPFLIKTDPQLNANTRGLSALSSIGSGRTSGSEPEDSTQYECDSEGTSTTTNSEASMDRQRKIQKRLDMAPLQAAYKASASRGSTDEKVVEQPHRTLQEVFRNAVWIVLDHFYHSRGGYRLSPAEKRRNEKLSACKGGVDFSITVLPLTPQDVFVQRRQRLVDMLSPRRSSGGIVAVHTVMSAGPPFTIQRIAEVLISPERVSNALDFLLIAHIQAPSQPCHFLFAVLHADAQIVQLP